MAKQSRKKIRRQVSKLTSGIFDTIIDSCLFVFWLHVNGIAVSRGKMNIFQAIDNSVSLTKVTHINSLKRAIYKATTRNYLEKKKTYFKITQKGINRLKRKIPIYEKNRPWDGIIYLITYDIPEKRRRKRDYLRDFIEKLGCALLQRSVYLTPYNPKKLISNFVKENKVAGLVLVSELREGSYIGGKPIDQALRKIYNLDKLYHQYVAFIKKAEKGEFQGTELIMKYLAILKKDPQLPFELLPGGWPCKRANKYFRKELKKITVRTKKPS